MSWLYRSPPWGGGDSPLRYTPRRGDTLVTVADRFNVSVEDLRRWNDLPGGTLRVGHAMYVAEPVRLAPAGRSRGRSGSSRKRSKGGSRAEAASSAKRDGKSSSKSSPHTTSKPKKQLREIQTHKINLICIHDKLPLEKECLYSVGALV